MCQVLPKTWIPMIVACLALFSTGQSAVAQGLLWNLPADGTWVRYEGDYRHVKFRPASNQGDLVLQFRRNLEIRSVGSEMADFKGESVPCRWIEMEVVTGKLVDGEIQPGPGGRRIYKVLIPESVVDGKLVDESNLPVEFLPIVKGFEKMGDKDIEPIKTPALQVYPVLSMIRHFEDMQKGAAAEPVATTWKSVQGVPYTGNLVLESTTTRSTNKTNLWVSDEVPFGLAKWNVSLQREVKGSTDVRSDFKQSSEITVTMQVVETGADAQSKLATP